MSQVVMAATRTTMTFLFTDIEGSTRQWEVVPQMHQRVERHFLVLRNAVELNGGEVFATMGDGIAAAFVSAEAAVAAAIAAQREMPTIGVAVRMGIHTGEAERVDGDFRGRPVNRAARIMAVGHGGQILLSDVTAMLVRAAPAPPTMIDLGSHRLRDLAEPERMWQVTAADLIAAFPPVRGLDAYANNLPAQRSSLVGREREIARVIELVGEHRLVTLTGVGGVGKTRLAIQAAADIIAHFTDVWFVELASVTDPDDVVDTIARTIGARAVTDPLAAASALLGGGRVLLVVDNCEHVVDHAAEVIDALMASCPDLSVVTTSREPLGIEGEHVVAVRSLEPRTAGVELFLQRCTAAGADIDLIDTELVADICARLDGIPLAIELAAARAAILGVRGVADALDDRFNLLSGGRRRAVSRHSTMRATVDWSYRLLDPEEQRFFQHLAVFANGFELDAARHVAGSLGVGEHEATAHVESLVQKSMVVAEARDTGVRYRMLETMRAFALERLHDRSEGTAALTTMAEWVATITDLPTDDPCSAAVERNSVRLEREADTWREAVMFAHRMRAAELAGRLCGPPVSFFLLGRHDLAEVVRPLAELVTNDPRHRRSVLCALAVSSAGAIDAAALQTLAEEVQALDEDEPNGTGALIRWLALAWRGAFVESIDVCVTASLDPRVPVATRDLLVGIAALDRFSLTDATSDPHHLIDRALEVAERSPVAIHRVSCRLGAAWGLADRDPSRSLDLVRRALEDIDEVPPLTRLTLPGSASRLLTSLDPQIAARGLLEQLGPETARRSFIDLIPVFYASALLHRVGHASAGMALASLTISPIAPYLSMMDFVDLARRAATASAPVSLADLERVVRDALVDIACGAA